MMEVNAKFFLKQFLHTNLLSYYMYIDYSEENIKVRYRKDLAGQLGNLVSRSISPALNPSFIVPSAPKFLGEIGEKDANLYYKLQNLSGNIYFILLEFIDEKL
jgi:methionyl-tRNA synthetase